MSVDIDKFSEDTYSIPVGFRYSVYQLILTVKTELLLPAYKGSTLRGGFGHAFKRVVCALRNTLCEKCLLKSKYIYSYVFETPPPENSRIKPRILLSSALPWIKFGEVVCVGKGTSLRWGDMRWYDL